MTTLTPNYDELTSNGHRFDTALTGDGWAELYLYDREQYVVKPDNIIITREQDNVFGPDGAYFPYEM